MRRVFSVAIVLIIAGGAFLIFDYFRPGELVVNTPQATGANGAESAETVQERIRSAAERSGRMKGIYLTATVANDPGRAARKLRDDATALLDATELNGVVIDVKETEGGLIITDALRDFIKTLHRKGDWVVARQVAFKDSSQQVAHPDWYLMRKSGVFWRDKAGGTWLDPASREVWQYQAAVAKAASDAGFDEIQFDYIRFPSDGHPEHRLPGLQKHTPEVRGAPRILRVPAR